MNAERKSFRSMDIDAADPPDQHGSPTIGVDGANRAPRLGNHPLNRAQ
jgi:hypothetical protein